VEKEEEEEEEEESHHLKTGKNLISNGNEVP
jgi:hypothetical protein